MLLLLEVLLRHHLFDLQFCTKFRLRRTRGLRDAGILVEGAQVERLEETWVHVGG